MATHIAHDSRAFHLRQRRKLLFTHETFHPTYFLLPFCHCSEPRIRHSVRHPMIAERLKMTGCAPLREHPPIGCVQLRDSRKHTAAAADPQQRR